MAARSWGCLNRRIKGLPESDARTMAGVETMSAQALASGSAYSGLTRKAAGGLGLGSF